MGKRLTDGLSSEAIEGCDIKVGLYSKLNEYMEIYMY